MPLLCVAAQALSFSLILSLTSSFSHFVFLSLRLSLTSSFSHFVFLSLKSQGLDCALLTNLCTLIPGSSAPHRSTPSLFLYPYYSLFNPVLLIFVFSGVDCFGEFSVSGIHAIWRHRAASAISLCFFLFRLLQFLVLEEEC
ncbi:hypothetical protein VNO77_13185 [Canavalia gladiata]|uniref:Uncharacterized protein n=1 Tax=Canavalia gladiata TaxID=3824 RepID=A0AAN9QRH6_CANGL